VFWGISAIIDDMRILPGRQCGASANRRQGFTLIELLVVTATIAVLVAVLMPALSGAKRRARLVACSNNIRQVITGLTLYAGENDDRFPPRKAWNPNVVQWADPGHTDMRRVMYGVAGRQADVLWCPLIPSDSPWARWDNPTNLTGEDLDLWSKVYFIDLQYSFPGHLCYRIGYAVYAGVEPLEESLAWDWSHSGNEHTNQSPHISTSGKDVLVADMNGSWMYAGLGDVDRPYSSSHSSTQSGYQGGGPFVDTNVGYGDGHVEWRNRIQHYVLSSESTWWSASFQY